MSPISSPRTTDSPEQRGRQQGDDSGTGILVIGDDAVGVSVVRQLGRPEDTIFVGMDDRLVDRTADHMERGEIGRLADLFDGDIGITPRAAIVATSQDSRNLLLSQRLRLAFDLEAIAVRVDDPQNIDAFADLPVDLVDCTHLVGSELVRRLGPTLHP